MKREDADVNLNRHERQQELERLKKVEMIELRDERMIEIKRQKEEINNQKKELSTNLAKRKKALLDKVNGILLSGDYRTKEDIYKRVFNDEELKILGYFDKDNDENIETKKNKTCANFHHNNQKDKDMFFLTQGGNIDVKPKKNK